MNAKKIKIWIELRAGRSKEVGVDVVGASSIRFTHHIAADGVA